MGLSRAPSSPLIPELFLCFGRCFLGRTRWFWGHLGWPLLKAWESSPVSDKGYSFQGQVLSLLSPEHAGSSRLQAFFRLPLGSVSSRDPMLGLWRSSLGLRPPPHPGRSVEAAGLLDLAWKAPHRHVTGAACGVCPQEASAVSVGLDLSLELLVDFSGGPGPLKSTEVQQWPGRVSPGVQQDFHPTV